jgi:glycosyltransferase involved in cell wall biosynthesis
MASGVPVVTTSVGGVPELVQDGANGAMVPPGDPALVAQALAVLLADPDLRVRMGRAARARVEDDYDVNAAAQRLAGIFGTHLAPAEVVAP